MATSKDEEAPLIDGVDSVNYEGTR